MVADLTFTVELDPVEAQVLQMLADGWSYDRIWCRLRSQKVKISLATLRKGLILETKTLDLAKLTMNGDVRWKFQR
jgi:hypothetical protein